MLGFYNKILRGERPDLQVLCFNCNCAKHINGGTCPHSEKKVLAADAAPSNGMGYIPEHKSPHLSVDEYPESGYTELWPSLQSLGIELARSASTNG